MTSITIGCASKKSAVVAKLILALGLALSQVNVANATQQCTQAEAMKAEAESSSLTTWHEVIGSYERYRQCDDGAISEGYSASVAALLASHWEETHELKKLFAKNHDFEQFVIRHIDETMTAEQGDAIKKHVQSDCSKADCICKVISKRLSELGLTPKRQ